MPVYGAWSRPVRNGRLTPRRPRASSEPPLWLAVSVLAVLGYGFTVVMLSL